MSRLAVGVAYVGVDVCASVGVDVVVLVRGSLPISLPDLPVSVTTAWVGVTAVEGRHMNRENQDIFKFMEMERSQIASPRSARALKSSIAQPGSKQLLFVNRTLCPRNNNETAKKS